MLIKLWDWDKKWQCSQVFEGHSHYVMMVVINPKDHNQFASASLDRSIKVMECHAPLLMWAWPVIALCCVVVPRCGSWAPPTPTSLWTGTTRGSTASTTSREETSRTSSQGPTTGEEGARLV